MSLSIGNTVKCATAAASLLYITAELEQFGLKGINFIVFFARFRLFMKLKKVKSREGQI